MKTLSYTVGLAILSFFTVSCSDENNDDVTNGVSDSGYTQDNETTKEPVRCKDGIETLQVTYYKNEDGDFAHKYEVESGIEYCPNSSWHRYEAVQCVPRTSVSNPICSPSDEYDDIPCLKDTDCTERENGKCIDYWATECRCLYECLNDSDCNEGEACFCSAGFYLSKNSYGKSDINAYNECVPTNCRTDDDCDGYRCGVSEDGDDIGLYCHTPKDKCNGDSDCGDYPSDICVYNKKEGYWICGERSIEG